MASHPCSLQLVLLISVGLLASGCASSPADVDPDAPAWTGESQERVDAPPFLTADVVIAIDHSALALLASGVDVDKDGVVGRTRNWVEHKDSVPRPAQTWTTDSSDTVEALQLVVARALVPRLADRQNRVGLVSLTLRGWTHGTSVVEYTDKPKTVVPVGPPDPVLAALANFPAVRETRRTDLSRLLEVAADVLDEAAPPEPLRERAIVLLSLGQPSAPNGIYWSSREAIEFAKELGERGIAVWAVPFAIANVDFLDELTRGTGGRVVPLEDLDAVFGPPPS